MSLVESPDTWIGLAGVALVQVGTLTALLIQQRRSNRDLGDVKDQVQNSHTTNLRDDIDGMKRSVEALVDIPRDIRGIREDIGGMRGELREEREARLNLQHQVDAALRRRT